MKLLSKIFPCLSPQKITQAYLQKILKEKLKNFKKIEIQHVVAGTNLGSVFTQIKNSNWQEQDALKQTLLLIENN
jgi:hypothetical protein